MKTKLIELLAGKGLFFRENAFKEEVLEYDMMTDEYKTIKSVDKFDFNILKKYKLLTIIVIAARNIDPDDDSNFFNNANKIFTYNPLDQTVVVITPETGFMKVYLKSMNLDFRCVEYELKELSTIPLIKAAAAAASPNTDFFLISFFNQEFVTFDAMNKIIRGFENAAGKSVAIPLKDGRYINPVIINKDIMNKLKAYDKGVSFTAFLKLYENVTEFIDLD
ncbi:MAG TPA: hypothetical protein PKY81_06480 [bacterium]|nr:hypothetical protein [bacterium]